MRKPFQSLRCAVGVSLAGATALIGSAAFAQQPPTASPIPVEPTRPPDCLDCPPAPARPPALITNPTWVRRPTPEYPGRALARGISGQATIACLVHPDGTLSGCRVVDETPAGYGFGQAAVAAAAAGRLSPRSLDRSAPGARAYFTINFRLPDPEPLEATTPSR